MTTPIAAYIIKSKYESTRNKQVGILQNQIINSKIVEAIFPKFQHVPFINKMIKFKKNKKRTLTKKRKVIRKK